MLIGSRSRGKGVVSAAADRKQEVRTESNSGSRHSGSQSGAAMAKGGGNDAIRSWWASAERKQESRRSLRAT